MAAEDSPDRAAKCAIGWLSTPSTQSSSCGAPEPCVCANEKLSSARRLAASGSAVARRSTAAMSSELDRRHSSECFSVSSTQAGRREYRRIAAIAGRRRLPCRPPALTDLIASRSFAASAMTIFRPPGASSTGTRTSSSATPEYASTGVGADRAATASPVSCGAMTNSPERERSSNLTTHRRVGDSGEAGAV